VLVATASYADRIASLIDPAKLAILGKQGGAASRPKTTH
jgi:hypothetical protein